jgi:hypothetical protein
MHVVLNVDTSVDMDTEICKSDQASIKHFIKTSSYHMNFQTIRTALRITKTT